MDAEIILSGINDQSRDCCLQRLYWSEIAFHCISERAALANVHNKVQMG